MHFCIPENQSWKQFWKSSLVKHPIVCYKTFNISLSLLNWIPCRWFFSLWNRKKLQGIRSGEYGGFWYDSTLFSAKYWVVIQARWDRALSSSKINPWSSVFSHLYATALKTVGRQFVTYDHALIEAPDSNAIDPIKPDFIKKIATIRFPNLLFLRIFVGRGWSFDIHLFHCCLVSRPWWWDYDSSLVTMSKTRRGRPFLNRFHDSRQNRIRSRFWSLVSWMWYSSGANPL